MAKALIEIPVDAAQFERFIDLFSDYQAKLESQPEIWAKVNAAMAGALGDASDAAATAKTELGLAAAQAALIAEALAGAHKAAGTVANDATQADRGLGKVAKTAQSLGKSIIGAGKSLVSGFGPAALAALGIGAIGSGFGIVGLADAALARWKTAAGLGMTPGQLGSYQVYGQPYLGPGALQGAANAQTDLSKAGWLAVLGISQERATREPASVLAFQELLAARDAWKRAAPGTEMQQPGVQAALALGLSQDEMRRSAAPDVTTAQLKATADAVARNARAFDLLAQAWIPLKIQLDAAGRSIETNLSNALARADLPQALTGLSKDFESLINSLINSGGVTWALKELGQVAQWLQAELTPKNIKAELAKLELNFHDVATYFGGLPWKQMGADLGTFSLEIHGLVNNAIMKKLIPYPTPDNPTQKVLSDLGYTYNPSDKLWINDKQQMAYNRATNTYGIEPLIQPGPGTVAVQKDWAAAKKWLELHRLDPAQWFHGSEVGSGKPINNPGDIRSLSGPGFSQYPSIEAGTQAEASLLARYIASGRDTIAKIITTWAPPSENDTAKYIKDISTWTGLDPDASLTNASPAVFADLVAAMSRKEGTAQITPLQAAKYLSAKATSEPRPIVKPRAAFDHQTAAADKAIAALHSDRAAAHLKAKSEPKPTVTFGAAAADHQTAAAAHAIAALRSDVRKHGSAYEKFLPKAVRVELESIFGEHTSDADILKALHIAVPKATIEHRPEPKPNDSAMTRHTDRLVKAIKAKARPKPVQVSIQGSPASRVAISMQAAAAGAFT